MRRCAVIVLFAVAACGPGETITGDDDGGVIDAPEGGMSGLVFRFTAPDVGVHADELTIDRFRGNLRDIRALGDAAPGDARTSQDALAFDFDGTEGKTASVVEFHEAPPGRYSSFEFVVDAPVDGDDAWRLEGDVLVESQTHAFNIEDDEPAAISLELADVVLGAGETATITIEIDLFGICDAIDWESIERDGNTYDIDDDSEAIIGIRTSFATSFSIADVVIE